MTGLPLNDHSPPPWVADVLTARQMAGIRERKLVWQKLVMRSDLPSTHRWVATVLATFAHKSDGLAWPSIERLAEDTGYSARAVRNALYGVTRTAIVVPGLVQLEWVAVVEPAKRNRPARFVLSWPATATGMRPINAEAERGSINATTEGNHVPSTTDEMEPRSGEMEPRSDEGGPYAGQNHEGGHLGDFIDPFIARPSLAELFLEKLTPDGVVKHGREIDDKLAELVSEFGENGTRRRLSGITRRSFFPSAVVKAARRVPLDEKSLAYENGRARGVLVVRGLHQAIDALDDNRQKYHRNPELLDLANQGTWDAIAEAESEAVA